MTRRLLLLNGLAVVAAVIYHATGWGFTALFWWTDRYEAVSVPDFSQLGGATYFGLRVVEQLVTASVPAFLFVSGHFVAFAAGHDLRLGWRKVSGRIKMLLIPYLLWSTAILVWRALEGVTDTPVGYLEQIVFGQAAAPYYYVPLIIQLYLLSPLVVPRLGKHWKLWLAAAALLQLVTQLAQYPVLLGWDVPPAAWLARHTGGWFFPRMVFWFVLGAVAGSHASGFKAWVTRWKPVLPALTVALGVAALLEWELILRLSGQQWLTPTPTVLDSLYSAAIILTFAAFAQSRFPFERRLDVIGARSFGVYLIHAPVLEVAARATYHLAPPVLGHQVVFQVLLVAAGVSGPLMLMAAVNRSPFRSTYNYLFG